MSAQSPSKETSASEDRSPWSRSSVLLSGALLLTLVLLGIVVSVIGSGGAGRPANTTAANTSPESVHDKMVASGRAFSAGEHGRLHLAARQPDGPVDQPAARAVGDCRVDAGAAEPGRLRAGALGRAMGDVLRA